MAAMVALTLAACGGAVASEAPGDARPDLPAVTAAEFEAHLAGVERPALVNVWASWCLPCRAEAPLLDAAFKEHGDRIEFIGVAIQDTQADAKAFLTEFGLDFDHFFDRTRQVPSFYGGVGVPITFFFGPNGELLATHNGILDDRTLALNIDELLRLSP